MSRLRRQHNEQLEKLRFQQQNQTAMYGKTIEIMRSQLDRLRAESESTRQKTQTTPTTTPTAANATGTAADTTEKVGVAYLLML